jgi:hypothetical protein
MAASLRYAVQNSLSKYYGVLYDDGKPCEYWKNEIFLIGN